MFEFKRPISELIRLCDKLEFKQPVSIRLIAETGRLSAHPQFWQEYLLVMIKLRELIIFERSTN